MLISILKFLGMHVRPTEYSRATQVNKITHKPKYIYISNHWTTLGELFPSIREKEDLENGNQGSTYKQNDSGVNVCKPL